MINKIFRFIWPIFFAYLAATQNVQAIEITPNYSDHATYEEPLILSGPIEKGDYIKLIKFLSRADRSWLTHDIYLDSPGGNVFEALMIANFFAKYYPSISIKPGGICASACVLIFSSGGTREIPRGSRIGLHNVNSEVLGDDIGALDSKLSNATKASVEFLSNMGMPQAIIDKMKQTSYDDIFWVDYDWLSINNLLPAFSYRSAMYEMIRKKCGTDPRYDSTNLTTKDQAVDWEYRYCVFHIKEANLLTHIDELMKLYKKVLK